MGESKVATPTAIVTQWQRSGVNGIRSPLRPRLHALLLCSRTRSLLSRSWEKTKGKISPGGREPELLGFGRIG